MYLAWEYGCRKVRIQSDSLLVVQRILQHLHEESMYQVILDCHQWMSRHWNCLVYHTSKEANYYADFLAKIKDIWGILKSLNFNTRPDALVR